MQRQIYLNSTLVFFFLSHSLWLTAQQSDDESHLMQKKIEHVVIVMLENRSFDNVLAWLYNENQSPSHFIPKSTTPLFEGLNELTLNDYTNVLRNPQGEVIFSCPPIKGIPSVAKTKFLNSPKFNPSEAFPNVVTQMGIDENGNGVPNMLGFLQDYANLWDEEDWIDEKQNICAVMETYTEKELPIMYGLARHYAVSDYWFSSVPTQTNPNRAFTFCGTSEGEVINGNLAKNYFQSDTIWNRLTEESPETTWSIFWSCDMIPILFKGPFAINTFGALKRIHHLERHIKKLDEFHRLARKGKLPHVSFIEPEWTISINLTPTDMPFQKVSQEQDIIVGLQGNDLHPPGDVRLGEDLLANIYTSLVSNKEAWEKTLLIITFDEHGGLFDHVPPPSAIAPDTNFQHGFDFDRFGIRVPTIFISPLIEKGTIIRSDNPEIPFDHTSLIATLLKWRKIDKSKWKLGKRVENAPTFENVVTLSEPRKDYILGNLNENSNKAPVRIGDEICLRNGQGDYLCYCHNDFFPIPSIGPKENKMVLKFSGGYGGILTHGSFSHIKSDELTSENYLENKLKMIECDFAQNNHSADQWWTIKSLDNPSLGAEICYGDRIYIENHVYFNLFQLVTGRLAETKNLFGKAISMIPITYEESEKAFWIIEKP